jgi:acyl transferase domain-containing protein/NAD(P)H-dependent flavin oxidoreductase YrpB (nitropropane dioxygenase family)
MSVFEIFAISPPSYLVPDTESRSSHSVLRLSRASTSIALAAARAGYTGILDFEFLPVQDSSASKSVSTFLTEILDSTFEQSVSGSLGIRCGISQLSHLQSALEVLSSQLNGKGTLILTADTDVSAKSGKNHLSTLRKMGLRVLVEINSVAQGLAWQSSPIDGFIAKGTEASGRVGEQTTFVLLQECVKLLKLPVLAEGGIGLHTAAASYAAGAAGVIISSPLWLARESHLPFELKAKFEQMDGTETALIKLTEKQSYRVYSKPSHDFLEKLTTTPPSLNFLSETVFRLVSEENPLNWIFPLGQDIAFAKSLADRFVSVAGILDAIHTAAFEHVQLAREHSPLAPNSPLAKSHQTTYPIVQGAMTRVSDTADFAHKVAEGGGLPFVALALMRKNEAEKLLADCQSQLGENLSWGVGILGFVPSQLRQEQLEVIEKYKPPYALIAGGRPDQAKFLEDKGIKTYLHVPSPLLLTSFIEMGSRRFIFEGKECGGHVGPRSSFILWEIMVERLLENIGSRADASTYHILFAGGVHDGLSSAMVAALSAPLAAKGVKVGVLMGTAYLFTEEAVSSGAIVKTFQESAINCQETVLLETGPGHAIRCIDSPYKQVFDEKRESLAKDGKTRDQIREELELMNLGRLRIASKGLTRSTAVSKDQLVSEMSSQNSDVARREDLSTVPADKQWAEGMYMIGQVASMRTSTCTIKELHEEVSAKGSTLIAQISADSSESLTDSSAQQAQEGIAIIGMSCLLPKAQDVDTYWHNILNKVDTIEEVPEYQWDWKQYYDKDPQAKDKIYSKWGGFLENIEFDPTKYGIPPSSLQSIDPMQVLLLEAADAALKDAGYDKRAFPRENTSVILANAGHGPITALYSLRSMLGWKLAHLDPATKKELEAALPEWTEDSFPGYLGNVTAGRVANRFDLGGVNFSIDAACASSLAALHTAMAELRNGNSDVVLLSASDTHNQPGDYLSFSKTHAFSASGRCRTFDASADGIVISEGIAMLVLKRLSDAERDGDRIYAVVRGIGGSSDGRDLSLTAPRPAGQVKALLRAYKDANMLPSTVSLVEAHGTGTIAGDKAEVEALKQVFENTGARKQACAIGSVKTMIGHTKAAAGLASLIKVAKALHHKVLPPTIGVKTPNPLCHFEDGPFYINSESRPWLLDHLNGSKTRRAGVSAFGFGGTNFHAILEEYVPKLAVNALESEDPSLPAELFLFYGKNRTELTKSVQGLSENIKRNYSEPADARHASSALASLALAHYLKGLELHSQTHPLGQKHEKSEEAIESPAVDEQCLAIIATSIDDLSEKLGRAKSDLIDINKQSIKDPRGIYYRQPASSSTGKIAFLFPGQGSQYTNMLGDLTKHFGELRQTFEQANEILSGLYEKPLSEFIFPPPSFSSEEEAVQNQKLTDTRIAQPAIGIADVAMLSLVKSLGLKADMVAGHSYGEYVALYAAGVLTLKDLLNISATRGNLLAKMNPDMPGAMAAVSAPVEQLREALTKFKGITIANINSPNQTVIAGATAVIEAAIPELKAMGLGAKRIAVSQAFHSPLMEHASADLGKALANLSYAAAQTPIYSNIDGKPHEAKATQLIEKLQAHITKPVDFVSQIKNMHAAGANVFVEVGPNNVLTNLVESILPEQDVLSLSLDRSGRNGVVSLLHALGQLASYGVKIDVKRLYSARVLLSSKHKTLDLEASKIKIKNGLPVKPKRLLYQVNSAYIKRIDPVVQSTVSVSTANSSTDHNGAKSPSPKSPQLVQQSAKALSTTMTKSSNPSDRAASTNVSQGSPVNAAHSGRTTEVPQNLSERVSPPTFNSALAPGGQGMSGRNVDQVMINFQETMLKMTDHFLETQQKVMQAYLQGQQGQPLRPQIATKSLADIETQYAMAKGNGNGNGNGATELPQPSFATAYANVSNPSSETSSNLAVAEISSSPADQTQAKALDLVALEQPPADTEYLINSLLEIVSERTGYPSEMLDPNLDLEADLGIDSIKRVEILNSFRRILPEAKQKQLEAGIEDLAGTKTLQGIIDWLRSDAKHENNGNGSLPTIDSNNGNGKHIAAKAEPNGNNGHHHEKPQEKEAIKGARIRRGIVTLVPLEAVATIPDTKVSNKLALITDDEHGLANALSEQLQATGFVPVVLTHERSVPKQSASVKLDQRNYRVNLTDADAVSKILQDLTTTFGAVHSLFHLQSFGSQLDLAKIDNQSTVSDSIMSLFLMAKHLGTTLSSSAKEAGCGIIAATSMGGSFSVNNTQKLNYSPMQAGIAGLIKSAAKELKDLNCKVVDFNFEAKKQNTELLAKQLRCELFSRDGSVEVGYLKEKRFGLAVQAKPISSDDASSSLPLTSSSVVLVTGGARGITAEIALELATRYQPTMIIVGRSPSPTSAEDIRLANLNTAREIKGAIIEQFKAEGKPVGIRAVEERYQSLMNEREIRNNLAKIKAAGARLEYRQVDVRDAEQLTSLLSDTYASYGEINAVIHGAGVIEDSFLKDKSLDSFKKVFETKVLSALTLVKHLKLETLDYLVLFSSVVARTGNAGQADYVAANEVLNQLAQLSQRKMRGRSMSIMWGPWKAGMAQPELESIFAAHGWAMIDVAAGRQSFVDELTNANKDETQILLVAELDKQTAIKLTGPKLSQANVLRNSSGDFEFLFELNPDKDIFLADHALDGVPVMPMAFALEFMSEAVSSIYPGWHLLRIESLDIPSGIVFDTSSKSITITVHEDFRTEEQVRTVVSLSSGTITRRTCFRANFELVKEPSLAEVASQLPLNIVRQEQSPDVGEIATVPPLSEIYGKWLFHGPLFQGIKQIEAIGSNGVVGLVRTSKASDCLTGAGTSDWVIDPIMLDSAMQLGGIWARQFLDITVLPTGFRRLTQFSIPKEGQLGVRVFMSPDSGVTGLTCDVAVYDSNGSLSLLVEGLGGVGSKSLNRLSGGGLSIGAKR